MGNTVKPIQIPSGVQPIDVAKLRADRIAKEAGERFAGIAEKITKILINEGVLVKEIPEVVSKVTEKLNKEIDNSEVRKILSL